MNTNKLAWFWSRQIQNSLGVFTHFGQFLRHSNLLWPSDLIRNGDFSGNVEQNELSEA